LNGSLPISERFFAGGGNSIRGFDFEEAGPRVVVVPTGIFRDSNGNPVFLDPFTIPFGGNAIAVVNLEARVALTKSLRAVPFYDGGNVFKNPREIFNPADTGSQQCQRRQSSCRLDAHDRSRVPGQNSRRRRIRDRLRIPAEPTALPDPARRRTKRHLSAPARSRSLPILAGVLERQVKRQK
jgi:hypothetical protein